MSTSQITLSDDSHTLLFGSPSAPSSTLDLDLYLGVRDGDLVWGKTGFSLSSQNAELKGEGEGLVLRAECLDQAGDYAWSEIKLAEKIKVEGGKLVYLG